MGFLGFVEGVLPGWLNEVGIEELKRMSILKCMLVGFLIIRKTCERIRKLNYLFLVWGYFIAKHHTGNILGEYMKYINSNWSQILQNNDKQIHKIHFSVIFINISH